MSRMQLRNGDIAVLGRLNLSPLEIGDLPVDSVARLSALGLLKKVLGCCEITRAGQLAYQRHQFVRASGGRIARVTRRHPVFLHEARFGEPASRNRLTDLLKRRRESDPRIMNASIMPRWLVRLAAGTAFGPRRTGEAPPRPGREPGRRTNQEIE